MNQKLSFLALFAAAAMLCAAPALSLKNAFLPNAGVALSVNLEAFNNSFLGEYANHDVVKELAKIAEVELNPNDPAQTMFKALLEKSTITLATALTVNEASQVTDNPENALQKTLVCVQLPQPIGPMVDAAIVALTNQKSDDTTIAPTAINECKGVQITDKDDGTRLALVFDAEGKFIFIGAPELLAKQLTDAAAAAAPANLVAANASGLPGAFASLSMVVNDELKAAVAENNPQVAGFVSTVENLNLSAAPAGSAINVKLVGNFLTPEIAGSIKAMADEYLPQVKAMAPSLTNGQEVAFLDTIAAAQDGKTLSLTLALTQQDIATIVQAVNTLTADTDDGDDDDDDDDDDGIEVQEL